MSYQLPAGTLRPKGMQFVVTEKGNPLEVRETLGYLISTNGEAMQVKRAWVNASSGATTELIPAVSDKVIRIVSLFMLGGGTAPTVTFKSASTAISPDFTNAANGGAVLPFNAQGWMQGVDVNQAINVTVTASSDVGVIAQFIEIPQNAFNLL